MSSPVNFLGIFCYLTAVDRCIGTTMQIYAYLPLHIGYTLIITISSVNPEIKACQETYFYTKYVDFNL